jgi:hypothetical protein
MPRKPIFIGFPAAEVRMRGLHHKLVGTFTAVAKFATLGGSSKNYVLQGEILFVREYTDGKLLILRNAHKGDPNFACTGWTYIPIWIDYGCGQHGVVAFWKDQEIASHLEAQRAIDDWNSHRQGRLREREVACSMAL